MPAFKDHPARNKESFPFAHSAPSGQDWEPLFTPFGSGEEECSGKGGQPCALCHKLNSNHGHLNKVAWWSAKFASEMFPAESEESKNAGQWGYLAGLWHDLGKFSAEFQDRLTGKRDRANHSTAGAQHAHLTLPGAGQILAYQIAGHHAGLADLIGGASSLSSRLRNHDYLSSLHWESEAVCAPQSVVSVLCTRDARAHALFTRLLFSSLVDADYLATEAFMNPDQAIQRARWPSDILQRMADALDERYAQFGPISAHSSEIDRCRATVHADCMEASKQPPGLFTLTVPTGGGKTLASLAFALQHAIHHGLRQVIYVVPYTSIIEQNASEYRDIFARLARETGNDPVLEHHSNFEAAGEDSGHDDRPVWKLITENWDAPLVVTTSVQFFESLYANRSSRCRKLHRIARSVVVFDEAQTLPPGQLAPCLDLLKQLSTHFETTAVLCTATQPALGKLDSSQPGDFARKFNEIALDLDNLPHRRVELVSNVADLFAGLCRTKIEDLGSLPDSKLVAFLRKHERALCILNTKQHANRIVEQLGTDDPSTIHLSAQLCPAHRSAVLTEIRRREEKNAPCRVIATTVVEAGVDIDFPIVYRSLTGLDSLAQAAGRCNRHGKLGPYGGRVFLFTPAEQGPPSFLIHNINASLAVLPDYRENPDGLLLPEAINAYFRNLYFQTDDWDQEKVLPCFQFATDSREFPCAFNFKSAAQRFQLISDNQLPVIVEPKPNSWPDQDAGKSAIVRSLIQKIRSADRRQVPPPADAHRLLQRYTVQIPANVHTSMVTEHRIQLLCDHRFPVLTHPENDYDRKLGLKLPQNLSRPDAFII